MPIRACEEGEKMISIVLPYFKRYRYFAAALEYNLALFQHQDIEIVLALDEPSEEKHGVELVKAKGLRARVLVNDQDHPWRPPCKAINVGIKHSEGEWIVVASPESIIMLPSPEYLSEWVEHNLYPDSFLTGFVAYDTTFRDLKNPAFLNYAYNNFFRDFHVIDGFGFLMVKRDDLVGVGGLDERRSGYGADDNCVRARLKNFGVRQVKDLAVRVAHLRDPATPARQMESWEPISDAKDLPKAFGLDFDRIAYDWKTP
jgi:GT2 family glycosyltransferase